MTGSHLLFSVNAAVLPIASKPQAYAMRNTAQNLFAFHTFKIESWRSLPVNSPGSDCKTRCFVAKDSNVRFDALTRGQGNSSHSPRSASQRKLTEIR